MKKYLTLLLIASSCAPVYLPNSRNSPMFRGGGEIQASASIGSGVEGQVAASVTDHIGVMANYFYINREPSSESNGSLRKHKMFEGGVGYYKNFESNFFEVFAGYGKGEGTSHDQIFPALPDFAYGRYDKIFFQPAFGFNHKMTHVSFVQRFSIIDFTEFYDGVTRIKVDEKPQGFYEPAVVGRLNFVDNHMFFGWQAGITIPLFKDPYFQYRSFILSASLGFRINAGPKPDSEKKRRDTR